MVDETREKEVLAAITGYTRYQFNFSTILSIYPPDRFAQFSPNTPSNPSLATQIYEGFLSAKTLLRNRIILPRTSDKTFCAKVAENISTTLKDVYLDYREVKTIGDLERVYYDYGWCPEGVTEMRSAWKYNDLKPRVYYAQGPTVYTASKYVQSIFNTLLDCFEVCHRILRFSTPYVSLEDATLYIYDYSSFTSMLHDSTRFIFWLADFFDDVPVRILDTREGLIDVSVGQLLRQYASVCNVYPEFTVHRLLPSEGLFAIRFHNCGMLGVPGNLASCTILHAIQLMFAAGSMRSVRCVGDDGLAIVRRGEEDNFLDQVNNCGVVAKEKAESWEEEDAVVVRGEKDSWHYTKRPIWRQYNHIQTLPALIFPSIELILELKDEYHRSALEGVPEYLRHAKVAKQVFRLLSHVASSFQHVKDFDLLQEYLKMIRRRMKWPQHGGIRRIDGEDVLIPCCHIEDKDELKRDPYAIVLEEIEGQEIVLPAFYSYDEEVCNSVGYEFRHRSSGKISLLERLGLIEKLGMEKEVFLVTYIQSAYTMMRVKRDHPVSYNYVVVTELPPWASIV